MRETKEVTKQPVRGELTSPRRPISMEAFNLRACATTNGNASAWRVTVQHATRAARPTKCLRFLLPESDE
jgi:hypothetical protein